jgi:class 3 adenylate cyclase/tetratricopeptide (TPR) repeat protein
MKCPKCQYENLEGMKFCIQCGSSLNNICANCGFGNIPQARFCGECGARLVEEESIQTEAAIPRLEELHARMQRTMPSSLAAQVQTDTGDAEGENRILTVLFADVSGSVATTENMSPEDAADLISECLKAMVDTILKYGGTINRFLGDSVLAFFGVPETHENDPERAILAALEMREAVTKLNLSISSGINTGMVYVGGIGPDSHREFAAMGTAVNLAARLEKEAEPDQILVGEATYRHTRRAFEFAALEPLAIKGITEPVTAYEVLKQLPRPDKIRGIEGLRADMIGREREFSQLKECVDDLLQGRGQIISVIGEAGVGKSRLVSELKGYTADRDMRWLEGRCVSIGESIGYWVFTDILRSYLEFADDDTPEALREKIVSSMQSLFPQRWEEVVPYVGNLLSVRFGNEWDDRIRYLPAEQVKYQTFLTLRDIFHTLSQQKPMLLILEDMHWSDNLSLDLLNLMMDDLSLAPMLLLCVYRPYREHRSWHISSQASAKCLDRYTEVTLRGLTEHESRRLVQSLLRIENLPDSIRESILQKAEGNPFFVEEVIRSLIESDVIYQDGDRWYAREEVSDITVPDTIQSVIMSRIDRLEDEVRYVLQSAAVIGRLFRHRLLQYTTRQEQHLDRYLWQLEDRDIVYEEHAIPELEYSFRHVLTQETAYSTILSRRRREFHGKVAEGYEALYASRIEECYEELAYHYSRSDDKQKALDYLVKAGDKSREVFANDEAIAYYNQALGLIDDTSSDSESASTLGHIYQNLGEIYFPLTEDEGALECLRKALDYTTDKKQRARIYGTMGFIYQRDSKMDLAEEHLNAGMAELGDDTESPEMAAICIPLAWVAHVESVTHPESKWNIEDAIEIALRGLKIVENTEHYSELQELYRSLAVSYGVAGDIDKVFEYARRAMDIAQKSGNVYLTAHSVFTLGWAHWFNGESDAAIKFFREAMESNRKMGHVYGVSQSDYMLTFIYMKRNDWDKAIEHFERWSEPHISLLTSGRLTTRVPKFAWIYLQKGSTEKAIELCRKTFEVVGMSNSMPISQSLSVMEEAFAVSGRGEEFISCCEEIRAEKKEILQNLRLTQWYLEPQDSSGLFTQIAFEDAFDKPNLSSEWEWVDPDDDSGYSLSSEAGWLELRATSGSNLRKGNLSAPRLLQEISGDFSMEVKMKASPDNLPLVGGILVWVDQNDFIRFEKGMHLENEISLSASIHGEYDCFGRGRLSSDVLYLRLERMGNNFSAYCSGDGENWMTCGEMDFPVEDPIYVGIHAIGDVGLRGGDMDTATRFVYFKIQRKES